MDEYENEANDGQKSYVGEESNPRGDNTTQLEQQMHNVECPKAIVNLATKLSSSKPTCDANGTTFAIGMIHASKTYLIRKPNSVMNTQLQNEMYGFNNIGPGKLGDFGLGIMGGVMWHVHCKAWAVKSTTTNASYASISNINFIKGWSIYTASSPKLIDVPFLTYIITTRIGHNYLNVKPS